MPRYRSPAVDKGILQTFAERPDNAYLQFNSKLERDRAFNELSGVYGSGVAMASDVTCIKLESQQVREDFAALTYNQKMAQHHGQTTQANPQAQQTAQPEVQVDTRARAKANWLRAIQALREAKQLSSGPNVKLKFDYWKEARGIRIHGKTMHFRSPQSFLPNLVNLFELQDGNENYLVKHLANSPNEQLRNIRNISELSEALENQQTYLSLLDHFQQSPEVYGMIQQAAAEVIEFDESRIPTVQYLSKEQSERYEVTVQNNQIAYKEFQSNPSADLPRLDQTRPGEGWCFVISDEGKMYSAPKKTHVTHHSSFTRGEPVKGAGLLFNNGDGRTGLSFVSGHYRPSFLEVKNVLDTLESQGMDLSTMAIYPSWKREDQIPGLGVLYQAQVSGGHPGEIQNIQDFRQNINQVVAFKQTLDNFLKADIGEQLIAYEAPPNFYIPQSVIDNYLKKETRPEVKEKFTKLLNEHGKSYTGGIGFEITNENLARFKQLEQPAPQMENAPEQPRIYLNNAFEKIDQAGFSREYLSDFKKHVFGALEQAGANPEHISGKTFIPVQLDAPTIKEWETWISQEVEGFIQAHQQQMELQQTAQVQEQMPQPPQPTTNPEGRPLPQPPQPTTNPQGRPLPQAPEISTRPEDRPLPQPQDRPPPPILNMRNPTGPGPVPQPPVQPQAQARQQEQPLSPAELRQQGKEASADEIFKMTKSQISAAYESRRKGKSSYEQSQGTLFNAARTLAKTVGKRSKTRDKQIQQISDIIDHLNESKASPEDKRALLYAALHQVHSDITYKEHSQFQSGLATLCNELMLTLGDALPISRMQKDSLAQDKQKVDDILKTMHPEPEKSKTPRQRGG